MNCFCNNNTVACFSEARYLFQFVTFYSVFLPTRVNAGTPKAQLRGALVHLHHPYLFVSPWEERCQLEIWYDITYFYPPWKKLILIIQLLSLNSPFPCSQRKWPAQSLLAFMVFLEAWAPLGDWKMAGRRGTNVCKGRREKRILPCKPGWGRCSEFRGGETGLWLTSICV